MPRSRSIERIAARARSQDEKARAKLKRSKTADSFQNFAAQLGIGADSQLSAGTYGFNPITRQRTMLEWIHRGSWLGGVAIDLVAEDMTRAGVDLRGDIKPDDIARLDRAAVTYQIWNQVRDTVAWARLYGGAIAVMLIDGQRPETPLRLDTIQRGQFKGLQVFDRWMVEASMNDLVTELGPDIGLPKFYRVVADAPALPRQTIHYSRCLRLIGIKPPYWQRVMEQLWGISVLERLWDRMIAFDSATTGAAQLVFKSYIRTYKIEGLRQLIATGGSSLAGLLKFVNFMRQTQGIEGVTLLDAKDDFQAQVHGAFGGLSEVILQMGQQLSGALQIPLVRLFGQSPVGLNATGESDLRTYYDNINSQQNAQLQVPVTRIYRALAAGEGIKLGDDFGLGFKSLWLLTETEKSAIAAQDSNSINTSFNSGIIRRDTALKDLKQTSKLTGRFSNISDEEIAEAEQEPSAYEQQQESMALELASREEESEAAGGGNGAAGKANGKAKGKQRSADRSRRVKDDTLISGMLGDRVVMGFPLVIEHERGSERYGAKLPADYGFFRRTDSAERGDQMDVFVGQEKNSGKIFLVDSFEPLNAKFDEHKIFFQYNTAEDALRDFRNYYAGYGPARRYGIVTELSKVQLEEWMAKGDMSEPFTTPADVQYGKSKNSSETCAKCKYYEERICVNALVARDPRVPETYGDEALKIVSPGGWCKEFKVKGAE